MYRPNDSKIVAYYISSNLFINSEFILIEL